MAGKNSNDDDVFEFDQDSSEFHFGEEETPVFSEEKPEVVASSKKEGARFFLNIWKKLKQNKIALAIVVLVVLYLLYQLVGIFSSPSEKTLIPAPVKQTIPAPTVQPVTPVVTAQPDQGLENQLGAVQNAQNTVSQRLNSLEQQNQLLQQQLNILKAQAAANASQIQSVDTHLEAMNNSLSILVKDVTPKPAPVVPVVLPKYNVTAVIPGRAWLQSSNGQTLTVRPGDVIPYYGRVTSINTDTGTVGTTSGTVFQFAINEQ